ncbi:DNA polymerase III subunit alpha [Lapidilactobacillus gannanensis]|uniref:DNA polymerase III subunit alpha n=1 Tax=Lapidilactobacillus gannanensis TaxID=2486002 RepID=A0ABW4BPI7_9LACO|nr:DNA polymerase III subunit alpha [Lapidilactobacillus gannanensis]
MTAAFVNLQVRSCYSLLQSSTTITSLIATAQQQGQTAIALTDLNTMYGAVSFYRAAVAAGIKPILGLTLDLPGLIGTSEQYQYIFLARNNRGYHQLFKLSSLKMTQTRENFTWALLKPYLSDLIVIVPPVTGEVATILGSSLADQNLWRQTQAEYFTAEQLYLGITTRGLTAEQQLQLQQFAELAQLPLVAVDDVRYLQTEDAFINQVLTAIADGTKIESPILQAQQRGAYYLAAPEESLMRYQQANLAVAAANTVKIAAACEIKLDFKRAQLPAFPVPDAENAQSYLKKLAVAGLKSRLGDQIKPAYQERLTQELSIINQMGFADYFLIVWDVIHHAHEVGIMTGPGRGSAAGSLVAYCLQITDVDPLVYQLLFERFLNPDRVNMPDIDLDIPDDRRDELIQYMHQHYGDEHMAQIITFGTMAAKQALRDVGRVFGLTQIEMGEWSRAVPSFLNVTLQTAYQQSDGLKNLVAASDRNRLLFKVALKLEGLPRHFSTHAAGIVLSALKLTDTVPVQMGSEGIRLTQFPKNDVEALGLLKMDFLGLRNLSILAQTVAHIQQRPELKQFNPHQIPLNDQPTLQLFQKGDTDGVFQFESSGIRQVLIKLHPTSFNDIVATNALYRPGPMENIDTFVARKNGRQKVAYPAPALAEVLADTYGVLVYQEQVMQVAVLMGGFTMAQADTLRRAVSKKKKADLDAAKQQFINGALKKGFSAAVAETVYDYIERFANYGFNKSHAVAYSMIAFWLAYLKVHFPAEFFLALLNANLNNQRKTAAYLQELRARKITVAGPDINTSRYQFALINDRVQFGFESIKGLRHDLVKAIISERQQNGRYQSLADFLKRLPEKFLKVEPLLTLAQVGCFDSFDQNRQQMVQNIRNLSESLQLAGTSLPLFDVLAPKVEQVADYPSQERLAFEKELLGVYLSGHPLENYQQAFQKNRAVTVANLAPQASTILVYLRHIKVIRTKKGEQMAFVSAEDLTADVEMTVFPQAYRQYQTSLVAGQVLLVRGKLDQRSDNADQKQFIVNQVQVPAPDQQQATVFLQLTADHDQPERRQQLEQILLQHHGFAPVILHIEATKQNLRLSDRFQVNVSSELISELAQLLGSENVVAHT